MNLNVVRGFSRTLATVLIALAMSGCGPDAGTSPQDEPGTPIVIDSNVVPNEQGPASRLLVNKVWRVTSPNRAPGTFYAFLSNGTLIMTSCVETYRLATWIAETPTRLEITEDTTVRYSADVLTLDETRLNLRLNLKNEQVNLELATPQVPFVCPDLPR
ncbi:MAG: hypothetical protein HOP16_15960 [Acidobacteria bacterium]|nr:hypothetical protein [Acidobacteriota bacterium]